jgi:hypothetical protein
MFRGGSELREGSGSAVKLQPERANRRRGGRAGSDSQQQRSGSDQADMEGTGRHSWA